MKRAKLYNAKVTTVHLVWAANEEHAIARAQMALDHAGFTWLDDPSDNAFVSEPVPEHGWFGEEEES